MFCYNNRPREDAFTQRLKPLVEEWRSLRGLPDEQVADRIREDSIDILVDLSGHTAWNRALVFARKPAPVQIGWLGYPSTSGLTQIDYRITDAVVDPPGVAEEFYAESLLRLPQTLWCFSPPGADVPVVDPPMLRNGFATFGSMNNVAKLSGTTLSIWAKVLAAIPDARLLVATVPEGKARSMLIARFEELGVARDRVDFAARVTPAEFLVLHGQIDVALDPFPCNGGMTTFETLWMGVPVVTLAGSHGVSRSGASLLGALGRGEWVAASPEQYVATAIDLVRRPQRSARCARACAMNWLPRR